MDTANVAFFSNVQMEPMLIHDFGSQNSGRFISARMDLATSDRPGSHAAAGLGRSPSISRRENDAPETGWTK
jgi:hypothetical protein